MDDSTNKVFFHQRTAAFETEAPLVKKPNESYRTSYYRFIALGFICTINFGPFFCFDNPQALEAIINSVLDLSDSQFDLLYSFYSLPNIILPLFGGIIIDKLSLRISLILFVSLIVIGQAIVTIGAAKFSLGGMLAGRFVFGLGGECLKMSQVAITSKWFRNKELAFAMGLFLCFSRIGSSLNSFFSQKIYLWTDSFYLPFLVGLLLCIFSLAGTFGIVFMDKKADEQDVAAGVPPPPKRNVAFSRKDFKTFGALFYGLLFNNLLFYGAFFGLNNNINDIYILRFGFDEDDAGEYIAIVYLISAIITPLFGLYLDRFGKRVKCILVSSLIYIVVNIFITVVKTSPTNDPNYYMIICLLGVALFYSIYAGVFWPCIPLVVEQRIMGLALGVTTCALNLMLFVNPIIVGAINKATSDQDFGYYWSEIYLMLLVAVGFFVTVWMYMEDMRTGAKLDKPGPKKAPVKVDDPKNISSNLELKTNVIASHSVAVKTL